MGQHEYVCITPIFWNNWDHQHILIIFPRLLYEFMYQQIIRGKGDRRVYMSRTKTYITTCYSSAWWIPHALESGQLDVSADDLNVIESRQLNTNAWCVRIDTIQDRSVVRLTSIIFQCNKVALDAACRVISPVRLWRYRLYTTCDTFLNDAINWNDADMNTPKKRFLQQRYLTKITLLYRIIFELLMFGNMLQGHIFCQFLAS
jgi:hypothetical protein